MVSFLAVNVVGFAVVNAFWHYLATGGWGFSFQAIRSPLGEMFIRPLHVLSYPWMIPVTGLLLGLVILVPLIVAVLHRLLFAVIFVATAINWRFGKELEVEP